MDKMLMAYSLMASLNSFDSDFMSDIYMPMFQRVVAKYGQKYSSGKDIDLQNAFLEEYGLNVPIYTIRSLLRGLERKLSRRQKQRIQFNVFKRGKSFRFSEYSFSELEDTYRKEEKKIRALDEAFNAYASSLGEKNDSLSIASFLHRRRKELVVFFANNRSDDEYSETEDLIAAEFLRLIKDQNIELYLIATDLYLGMTLGALLESSIDLNVKPCERCTYFLDTQVLLRALDLQDEDETAPAKELIELINSQKQNASILNVTMEELRANVQNVIDRFNDNIGLHALRSVSIQNACARKGWNQTDLQRCLDNFVSDPKTVLDITIENVPKRTIMMAKDSEDLELLKNIRTNKGSALHDVVAYFHVREKRESPVRIPVKAKYWFVTANIKLIDHNIRMIEEGVTAEIVSPDDLASMLWLRNPSKYNDAIGKIGIDIYIAESVHHSLPSIGMINTMADNILKYTDITPEEYAIAMYRLSNKSINRVNQIVDTVNSNHEKGKEEILRLIREYRNDEEKLAGKMNHDIEEGRNIREHLSQEIESKRLLEKKLDDIERKWETKKAELHATLLEYKRIIEMQSAQTRKDKLEWAILFVLFAALLYIITTQIDVGRIAGNIIKLVSSLGGLWGMISLVMYLVDRTKKRK